MIVDSLSLYKMPRDAWEEEVNQWLDQNFRVWVMGQLGAIENLANQISVGPHGIDGFIDVLQWLVSNDYTTDAMLEGRVNNIICAIDLTYVF